MKIIFRESLETKEIGGVPTVSVEEDARPTERSRTMRTEYARATRMETVRALAAGLAVTLAVVLGTTTAAHAAPGDLDTTFGGDGKVTTDLASSTDEARSVAIQEDGKIVVAGIGYNGDSGDFALVRYNPDGTLDATFDGDGKLLTDFGSNDKAYGVAIQGDGRIVVAGESHNGANRDFALARYDANGTLDATFSGDGKLLTDFGSHDEAYGVAIQGDDRIVVAGVAHNGANYDLALARYNPDGTLDTTFDVDGKLTTDSGSGDDARSVAIQEDGKIVVAGATNNDFALTRYNPDGALDATFDGDGKVTTGFFADSGDSARSVAIQGDGKIVVAGAAYNGTTNDFALARYNPDGALDTTFDGNGKQTTDFFTGSHTGTSAGSHDSAWGVAIQGDGRIVAAGEAHNGTNKDFALARYDANGALDATFDGNGKQTTDFGSHDEARSVAIQGDGKIVAAGRSLNEFALARYHGADDVTVPPTPGICTITGTSGADVLHGTRGDDVICGFGGNDRLYGYGGDDILLGGSGGDYLNAGVGQDVLRGGPHNDTLKGKGGRDRLLGHGGNDVLIGGRGRDHLIDRSGRDRLYGGPHRDFLNVHDGAIRDLANGGGGRDVCRVDQGDTKRGCP